MSNNIEDVLNQATETPSTTTTTRRGNEIFTTNKDGIPMVSREEYAKQELGIEIPIDRVTLPSKGVVYPEEHPLHNAEAVDYRAMTAREEDILLSQALIKKGTVITELIKSCLINKQINVNSLLSGDRNALMIAIRISGYGAAYEPQVICPQCNVQNKLNVNLADLPIKPLTINPVVPNQNIFAFHLPVSKKDIEFKFLTGEEEEKLLRENEARKKRGLQADNLITTRLQNSIISVNGNSKPELIAKFVQFLPAGDSRALRQYIDDNEPGVNMNIPFECSNTDCNYITEVTMPLGVNFFWPGSRK